MVIIDAPCNSGTLRDTRSKAWRTICKGVWWRCYIIIVGVRAAYGAAVLFDDICCLAPLLVSWKS